MSINPRPCHSEPVTDVTGVGIRNLLAGNLRKSAGIMRFGNGLPRQSADWLAMTGFFDRLRTPRRKSRGFAMPGCQNTDGNVDMCVGDGVLPWSAAEQMPLGYDVLSARQRRAARPPLGGGCRRSRLGERKPCGLSPSASASRCHLPRRGRQGETDSHASVRTGSE